jgi:hypothetical protein
LYKGEGPVTKRLSIPEKIANKFQSILTNFKRFFPGLFGFFRRLWLQNFPGADPLQFEIDAGEKASWKVVTEALARQEYYALDDKLRLRAFTAGRLNDCDAINQVKGIIRRNLESGGSITDFYKMTNDEILNCAGFGKGNMSYWETVYRTNEDAIHNAGRAMGFRLTGTKSGEAAWVGGRAHL